jgi:hypothetical protein
MSFNNDLCLSNYSLFDTFLTIFCLLTVPFLLSLKCYCMHDYLYIFKLITIYVQIYITLAPGVQTWPLGYGYQLHIAGRPPPRGSMQAVHPIAWAG